jgi:hypothetical protein
MKRNITQHNTAQRNETQHNTKHKTQNTKHKTQHTVKCLCAVAGFILI